MRVLAVASEMYPLVKTGGLADVVGALPAALAAHGATTRTLIPGYRAVMGKIAKPKPVHVWPDLFGGKARLLATQLAGLDLLVLDAPHLFDRPGSPYLDEMGHDFADNWRRFAALSRAGADIARGAVGDYLPDIVHVHDWQAALTLAYMRYDGTRTPGVVTIHNLAFQGQFGNAIFLFLGLPPEAAGIDGVEYYGGVGFLKAGMMAAAAITTVSPTYAQEIRTPEYGMGLDGLVNGRLDVLHGIVNGVDTAHWNPAADEHLPAGYTASTLKKREKNRAALEQRFGLTPGGLLVAIVSRLTWQKGMDVLAGALDTLVNRGVRFCVLGSGETMIESAFLSAAGRHKGRIGVATGYDEPLAHLIQGGADAILVPSRFEPCGLTQLYGLRYGCVPIVNRTGGLADTIIDANDAAVSAGVATGLQFSPLTPTTLIDAVTRAQTLFADEKAWAGLQKQGMKADVSWDRSARRYRALYDQLVSGNPR
ncbi:MAG: glycogen synthase GlgA [Phyllobacteriaceae bacterium]|nr:glycogen synthase GlgA [Phyllobacteriaceae bacterium]